MQKTRSLNHLIPFILMLVFVTSFVTPLALGASSDKNESISVDLSVNHPRKAVALVPSTDMPSMTLSSSRPVSISHRTIVNDKMKSFSIPDIEEASNAFPINYAVPTAPFSGSGGIDYGTTSWLLFDNVSSESFGDFQVSTNHTAFAMDDNSDELFEVDPEFNFYLQISISSTGPFSIRLNVFPDPGMGSRYEEFIILDPNGAPVQYSKYTKGDDEYFLLIAEKKGKYVVLIKPTDQKLFFNIQTSTYKPEVLDVDDELQLQIIGTPDSQLSQKEINEAILTFDWYKYSPKAGDILFHHFENIRGSTYNAHFAPNENNTGYSGSFGLNLAQDSKRPEYMLIIHEGTARYLLGVEKFTAKSLYLNINHSDKLRVNEKEFFKFNVSTPTSVQVQLTSESNGVTITNVLGYPHKPYVTLESNLKGTNTKLTNLFVYETTTYLLLENSLSEEAWFEITVAKNNALASRELRDAGDMTPPYSLSSPNAYVDSDQLTFDIYEDLPGATKGHLFSYTNLFYQKQLFWDALVGFAFNASNDLVAQHAGENIYHKLAINLFAIIDGTPKHVAQHITTQVYSSSSDYKQKVFTIPVEATFASSSGQYYLTVDSSLDNGSVTLPYESFCYYDIFTSDQEAYSYIEDIWFENDVNQTNLLIDTTESPNWIIKVPVEWMNWTDVELHFTNLTLPFSPVIIQNIRSVGLTSHEVDYLVSDQWDMPSDYTEIGNVTTGFGAATDEDFVYIILYTYPLYPGELSSLNITLTRVPTQLLVMTKEPDLGGSSAPGFHWIWTISGIAICVLFLKNRKI